MNTDENDILFTNKYIKNPELDTEIPNEFNDEFSKYYKAELEKANNKKITDATFDIFLDETNDSNDIFNTNKYRDDIQEPTFQLKRKTKEIKTYVSIDSRDRDKILYPKPNNFKIFLGKTFYNVKMIKLASIEFPNTNAVINSFNNKIYWRNKEDIDDDIIDNITKTYPVYSVELRIGSYITTTLTTEMINKLASIKRRNKTGDFHYFLVDLDIDTDIVTITSLILTQLPNNPMSVTAGLGLITLAAPNHGYTTGDIIYIVGGKNIAGITSATINGPQTISVLNANTIQFEVNVKAGETSSGGGNILKTGRKAPFQLLFGENDYTLAQNIGYPLENSSQRVDTSIQAMNNFYQVKITTVEPHNFQNTFEFIGQPCLITASGTTPNIDGNKIITNIIDNNSFLISVNTKIDFTVVNNGEITFNARTISIKSASNYDIDTVLITTFTNHNYEPSDIGKTITLYDTISKPSFNQSNTLYGVLSTTLLVIPGTILVGGDVNVSIPGEGGTMSRHDPLLTQTKIINTFTPGTFSIIGCNNHNLAVGDRIKFYNILTSPSILDTNSGIYTVYTVLDSNNFTINFLTTSYDIDVLNKELAYIGLADIIVSFPYHSFNTITNIISVVDVGYNVEITTFLPHNLIDDDSIRVMETNSTPSIDDGDYIVKVIDSDTFRINYPGGITTNGTSGIIGMSNNFYIYSATDVGGIESNSINKIKYNVKNIIDEHTFTFESVSFAKTMIKGGGDNIFISSLKHGFNGVQTNTKNSILNRSINLEGENYAFLCCPQLATMRNTGKVNNIFARITLDQSPGSMVFSFLSNPKEFDTVPLNSLDFLEFSIVNYDNTLYEFSDLDFAFVLEITEIIDTTESFNYSSRRGIN